MSLYCTIYVLFDHLLQSTLHIKQAFNTSDCAEYDLSNTTKCISMIWGTDSSICNPEPYRGSVCSEYLLAWQDCAVGALGSGVIKITTLDDQIEMEQLAYDSLQIISK